MDAGTTWVDTSQTAGGIALRVFVLLAILAFSGLMALGVREALGRMRAGSGGAARRAMGRPAPPPWATGEWACGRCRSFNRQAQVRCTRCGAQRRQVEMTFAPPEPEADVIPEEIAAGPGALVVLEHDPAAHTRALAGHWTLRVNGVTAGSASTRDGALALLRALGGTERVMFDPKGLGLAPYPLGAVIAAFEGRKLPITSPCPEAGERRSAATRPR